MKRLFLVATLILAAASTALADLQDCLRATVRISDGNSRGTGCVFAKSGGDLFILTNQHVAGNQGNRVSVEFWRDGHQGRAVAGVTIAAYTRANYHRDIAVVWVQQSALGGYSPPVIPLAKPTDPIAVHGIRSAGCPNGSWPNLWTGHVIKHDTGAGDVVYFVPTPAPGRSGSAIFNRNWHIAGLVAWRNSSGNRDGANDRDGYGIAMTHREIWAALRGRGAVHGTGERPSSHRPVQTIITPLQAPGHCYHGIPMADDCPS